MDERVSLSRSEYDALLRVVAAARGYFQHHISQAPHGPHAEAVTAALAAYDAADLNSAKGEKNAD